MTKLIKLSLAAALVATSAQAIEWSNSGKIYVKSAYTTTAGSTDATDWEFDADIKFKGKVADNVTAVVGFEADNDMAAGEDITKATVSLEETYFTYANGSTSVSMGRTPISTSTTDGELVQGFWGSTSVSGINLSAAYFNANDGHILADMDTMGVDNLTGAGDENEMEVVVVSANGTLGSADFGIESVELSGHSTNTTYTLGTTLSGVALGARLAQTDFAKDGVADGQTTILSASTTIGSADVSIVSLTTDAENAAFTSDDSSANTYELENFVAGNTADVKATVLSASMPVAANTSATLTYATAEVAGTDMSEIGAEVAYSFSKDTTFTFFHADYSHDTNADATFTKIDMKYSF